MLKKYRNTILITFILIISTLGLLYYVNQNAYNPNKLKNIAEQEFVGKYLKIGDFTDISRWNKTEKEFVLTKYDLIKPLYTYITHYGDFQNPRLTKENSKQFQILVIYYERTGLNIWKVIDFNQNTIRNTTWDKAIQSAKETDLSKVNLYKEQTIDHLPQLTPEEIKKSQALQELRKEKERPKTVQENIAFCEQQIYRATKIMEAINKGEKTFEGNPIMSNLTFLQNSIESNTKTCNQLKSELNSGVSSTSNSAKSSSTN